MTPFLFVCPSIPDDYEGSESFLQVFCRLYFSQIQFLKTQSLNVSLNVFHKVSFLHLSNVATMSFLSTMDYVPHKTLDLDVVCSKSQENLGSEITIRLLRQCPDYFMAPYIAVRSET